MTSKFKHMLDIYILFCCVMVPNVPMAIGVCPVAKKEKKKMETYSENMFTLSVQRQHDRSIQVTMVITES